jgi:hypothetical protein
MAPLRPTPEPPEPPDVAIFPNQQAASPGTFLNAQPLATHQSEAPSFRLSPAGPVPTAGPSHAQQPPDNSDGEEDKKSIDPFAAVVIEQSPPWLFSLAFHLLMVIVMGLIFYVNLPRKPLELNAETIYAEKIGDQLEFDSPGGLPNVETTGEVVDTPENLPPVIDPFAAPPQLDAHADGTMVSSDFHPSQDGLALSGRHEGSAMRQGLMGRYGGNATTDAAVKRGLEWLARNQRPDGSWSLAGPYSNGAPDYNDCKEAATAMALLAFQGDGNTHVDGKFKKNVASGWNWLLKQQDQSGCFFTNGGFNYRFYTQGQCTIAVCELYAMSKDTKFRQPAQRAVDYCLRSQTPEGGWRYTPNTENDVSVTGWIVMALQSAKMAGFVVPNDNLARVGKYLDSVAQQGGSRYPYQENGDIRRSMTAEALLMREYLGWKRDDPRLTAGINWITSPENLIDFKNNRDVYYWYYATQATRHLGGDAWKRWNKVMRQALPEQQVMHGKEAGSWDPVRPSEDQWGRYAGRLFVTCLSIYNLEVYYRHLPIYREIYSGNPPPQEPAAKKGDSDSDK